MTESSRDQTAHDQLMRQSIRDIASETQRLQRPRLLEKVATATLGFSYTLLLFWGLGALTA